MNAEEFQSPTPTTYTTMTCEALLQITPPAWRVKGLLPQTGVAFVYGDSGSGKTFLVIDIALTIASGANSWFGHRVKAASVLYVPLEGVQGIAGRVKAWHAQYRQQPCQNFYLVREGMFSLGIDEDVQGIADTAKRHGCQVIIIDTLARATPGMDENSTQTMGEAMQALEVLRGLIDALVIVVHHTGKNPAQGMRGSSALKAGADIQIKVEVTAAGVRSWQADKVKDGAKVGSTIFALDELEICRDEDGDPVTSCAVRADTQGQAMQKATTLLKGLGGNQEQILMAVRAALAGGDDRAVVGRPGVPDGVKSLKWQQALDIAVAALAAEGLGGAKPKERAKEALGRLVCRNSLQESGSALRREDKVIWVRD